MKWRIPLVAVTILALLALGTIPALAGGGGGFDQYGYNRTARVFVGTASSWCADRVARGQYGNVDACLAANGMTAYANDRIVMKWNAEWDRGNTEGWTKPPYDAWENNEWNGAFPGGSGEVWHYKIVWVESCGAVPDGGYCIWGQFAVIMDQGMADGEHFWYTHAIPTGYGAY